mgnify:CR=1 FL=1
MAYSDQQMSGNKIVAIIIVALIHVVIGYVLITGLAYSAVKKVVERVTTVDIEEPPPPEPEEEPPAAISYQELYVRVNEFAALLRDFAGLKKGDRVTLHMPMTPELPVTMLACARLGVIHSEVFGGFSGMAAAEIRCRPLSRIGCVTLGIRQASERE